MINNEDILIPAIHNDKERQKGFSYEYITNVLAQDSEPDIPLSTSQSN